ncbi:SDR family oxidoreductase [Marinobacter sp. S0848L]|uniref:SDR family oxidoreductase n=1 Tax=Marinobacter sp. S0848L TaxID=2926423 RepID=UPI001FF0F606|nr:SDR family oxidoreductase [Marinobacter sp. S0848L]MCK0106865.1 SDR family oxidoreductase [Marinobacter sp. S0848L]
MNESSQYIENKGLRLRVREWNKSTDTTIVLVHGYPDCSHIWDATIDELAKRFHVAVYDVRGAGKSDAPQRTKDYALEHLTADFRTVLDAVSPEKPVHLVGHDWGSIQCWEFATHPNLQERIKSYTSISGPSLDHVGYWLKQGLKSGEPAKINKIAKQVAHSWYIAAFHLPVLAPTLWKSGLDKLWPRLLQHVEGIAECPSSDSQRKDGAVGVRLYRANVIPRITSPQEKSTQLPVQLLVPKRDKFVTPMLFEDLHKWVPRLWCEEINCGHWIQVSHPEVVANRLCRFVDFIESGVPDSDAPSGLDRHRAQGERKVFSGKLAVVTGAGNGIGRETLLELAKAGADVIAIDIDPDAAARTTEQVGLLGARATSYTMDVGIAGSWDKLARELAKKEQVPDILINNAGIGMAGPFLQTSRADWRRILNVNLWSVIHGSQLFGKQMAEAQNSGVIINVSSAAAFSPNRSMSAYSTTKAAVRMLSDCMRADLAHHGVRVITVCPGIVNSGITDRTRFVGKSAEAENEDRNRASKLYARRNLSPAAVSTSIIKALINDQDEVLVGPEAYGLNLIGRASPSLSRWLAKLELA